MTLLDDFKTEVGETTADNDQYYVDNFLRPALDKLSELSVNLKKTTISLVNGTQSYDLTSSSIASPVVGDAGIYELKLDQSYYFPYVYKREVVLQDPTTLYFVDSDRPSTGTLDIKYKAYYSSPTLSPYVESDAPSNKLVYVKQWAVAHYYESLTSRGSVDGAIASKREDNLEIRYGDRAGAAKAEKMAAQEGMATGAGADFTFFSYQVI